MLFLQHAMKYKKVLPVFIFLSCWMSSYKAFSQHDIIFCGEKIPVDNNFVSGTLMNAIRKQIPNVNLPELRRRAVQNFPYIESYLQRSGLPEDLKYIAIVESGFQNLISGKGARGFWQLMPKTAAAYGLVMSDNFDERDDLHKSTDVACREIIANYTTIRKRFGISSWVLTAAAYNTGIGNMFKKINDQGTDYFSMSLNPETALYVYKIIAVKELFEYPELYMKDFGYNVFSSAQSSTAASALANSNVDLTVFNSMQVDVNTKDGEHPDSISAKEPVPGETSSDATNNTIKKSNAIYVAANIKGKYKNFSDGQLISIKLQENLSVNGIFNKKGNTIMGTGWLIDDRVMIDLGYDTHSLALINDGKKGIAVTDLKDGEPVLLRVVQDSDN